MLRSAQDALLANYSANHTDTPDRAIELPTVAGTSLVALPIKAPPSSDPSSSPAAGRPARSLPTSRHHAPDTAPTGTSPATTSEPKDKTPTASNASPNTCATAALNPPPCTTPRQDRRRRHPRRALLPSAAHRLPPTADQRIRRRRKELETRRFPRRVGGSVGAAHSLLRLAAGFRGDGLVVLW